MAPDPDDKEQFCPLCMEEFDLTDKSFHPCRCGYQVCIWCFHNIQDKLNGLCPACRTPYDKSSLNKLDPNLLAAAEADRKRKREQQRVEKATAKAAAAAAAAEQKDLRSDRSALQNVRVMQRNLVYVTGLPPPIAKEEILRRKEHFGRFGRIVKVAVNKKTSTTTHSAYVTFKRSADASDCISHLNSLVQEGKTSMRATFGTTKYCSFFLRHIQCNNPGCLYLHELANESECFTKEDLQHDFQMDEFDMDYHGSQSNQPADIQPPSCSTPSTTISQPKIDHSPVRRETAKPAAPILGESQTRSAPGMKPSVPSIPCDTHTLFSGASILRNSNAIKATDAESQQSTSPVSCDVPSNVPPSALSAQNSFLSYTSDSRPQIPRPPTQSRRSFVLKDEDDSRAQIVLPGISALGLGKADSGPFGWDSQRNQEPRGIQKAAISPPESPRTQQRVEQQKMFRSLLPNVDVSFIPQPNRSLEFNLFAPRATISRQPAMFGPPFSSQPPLVIEKAPIGSVVGPPPGTDHRPPSWSHTMPSAPIYPAGFDGYPPRDRAPRPPPPGLSASGNHQSMPLPPRFDRHSPPPGMAPLYDNPAPGMVPPRFNPRSQSPAGFEQQGSASEDFQIASQTQRYPATTPSNTPGLIQRPSMEPVLHINGAWFGM